MGHVIKNGLDVLGTGRTIGLDQEFKKDIYNMETLAQQQKVTSSERKHVSAVTLWAEGSVCLLAIKWKIKNTTLSEQF